MAYTSNLTDRPIDTSALAKRTLLGAAIGLAIISFLIFQVDRPDPAWGELWKVRPLIVTPLAGAAGGAFSYIMDYITYQGGWRRILGDVLSVIVFIIGIWFGTILGLVGTLWH